MRAAVIVGVGGAATAVLLATGGWHWPALSGPATALVLGVTADGHAQTSHAHVGRHGRSS